MLNLFKRFSKEIAIDLGTANTLVYVPQKGIVIDEPSFVAFDTQSKKVLAVGQKAKEMAGKTPQQISIIRPMKDGVIADFHMATEMLKYFIKKAIKRTNFWKPRLVIAVPFGITDVEKKAVRDTAIQLGMSDVTIILEPMAAAIGAGLDVERPQGNMVVDIGGGTTDAAIITMAGIVGGHSIKIAGDEMDEAVTRYVRHKYNLLIGPKTAETIKKTIGSANPLLSEGAVEVRGRDLARGIPCIQKISSEEIRDALAEAVFAIVETVRQTLEEAPPEVASDIMDYGIVLTGGGALLKNLDDRIKDETGLPVLRVDDPLTSVAMGAGKVMAEPKLLKKIALA